MSFTTAHSGVIIGPLSAPSSSAGGQGQSPHTDVSSGKVTRIMQVCHHIVVNAKEKQQSVS